MTDATTTAPADMATSAFDPTPSRLVPRGSLVLLVIALVAFIAIDLPLTAWAVAAGLWAFGVVFHGWVRTTAARSTANAALGLAAAAMFVRTTIALIVLLYVGVSVKIDDTTLGLGEPDIAAIALVLYTLVFTMDMGERIGSDMSARQSMDSRNKETK